MYDTIDSLTLNVSIVCQWNSVGSNLVTSGADYVKYYIQSEADAVKFSNFLLSRSILALIKIL